MIFRPLLLSTILTFFSFNICLSQDNCITLPGSVTLTSQAQLDLYWQQNPGICIDTIEGDLILAGDVVDISGFMGLRYIGGGVFAPSSLQADPSLRGLDSLTEIDDYLILNSQVFDLDALSNLQTIGRDLDNEMTGGFRKSLTFGAGSYDNLNALANLQLAQGCRLSISNCTIFDATGIKNTSGFHSISLYQSRIDTFPDLSQIDTLHQLYVFRVSSLPDLHFSGLEYLNELDVSQNPDLKSLTFDNPIFLGRRKIYPEDEFYDQEGAIVIADRLECLSADFRRADSLKFLEVRIAGFEPRPDCPRLDLSKFPMDRLNLSSANVGDTLNLPFYPPNDQFTWGNADRSKTSSKYGIEYRIAYMPEIKHIVLPDTGIMILGSIFSEFNSLVDVELDLHQDRGQIQALHIRNANSLINARAFEQIKGIVNLYERNNFNSSAHIDAPSILINDCNNIQLRKTDFENVDSGWGIWLENLPATSELPSFSNLRWIRQFGIQDVPIHQDTLFSDQTRIEIFFRVSATENNPAGGNLFVNHNPSLDTFAFFNKDLNYSGIELDYNHTDLHIEGLNDVKISGSLWVRNVNGQVNPLPDLLNKLEELNSLSYSNIENAPIPKIGKVDNLYSYAWQEDDGRWYTDQYNRTLKVDNALNLTDATAVCPLINSGNYEMLDLDPSNSYPLNDAALLISYCDSNRVSSISGISQWKAFAAYPTINTSGGTINFSGLEDYSGTLNYRILSVTGQEQGCGSLVNGNYGRIDAISLPNGLPQGQYFLDVLDDKGKRGTSVIQIIKQP